ncbi:uncharacterized protein [Aquarana catesbeiana]|uniref:uncharacterized protein n=1 Tax=Aquarana catesbeiana TaxID=8400 RepID=UPI003CCA43B0
MTPPSLLRMESCLLYCLKDYIEENRLLLILTAVLMVLALWKSLPCKSKAKGLVREVANTMVDGNSFSFDEANKEHEGHKDLEIQNGKHTLISTPLEMTLVLPSLHFSQEYLGTSESLHYHQPIQMLPESRLPSMDSAEPPGDHEMEEDTCTRHKPNLPIVTENQVEALKPESLDNKEQEGLKSLEMQSGKDTLNLTSTEKVAVVPNLHFSQGLPGNSGSLNCPPLVPILSGSKLPPMDFVECPGDHEMEENTSTWHKLNLPILTEDQVVAVKPQSLDNKEQERPKSLEIYDRKDTLILTSTENGVVLPNLHFSQGLLGSSESLHRLLQAWILYESKLQPMDFIECLGDHEMEENTRTVQKPNLPTEGKEEALKPKSFLKIRPTFVKFKRSVRPSSKEQSLSLASISAIGITDIISLDPPVCVLKSQKHKLGMAEMVLQFQNDMSSEQLTLPMDQLSVTDMNCVQKGIKVTQDSVTKTEPQDPHSAWQDPRSTRPRTITKVPKSKPTLKLHQEFDDLGRNPEIKAKLVHHRPGGSAKTEASNRNRADVKDKFLEFAKSFQKRIQEALNQ